MTNPQRFEGVFTAIVTPFKDGAVDTAAFTNLINRQLEGGVDGIVACLLYTSPSPRDRTRSRMPSSA